MKLQKNVLPEIKRATKELKQAKVFLAAKKPENRTTGIHILHNLGSRLQKLEFVDGYTAAKGVLKVLADAGFTSFGIKSFETSANPLGEGKYALGTWVTVQLFVPAPVGRKKGKVK